MDAKGFYFESAEEYGEKARTLRNAWGNPVEELEIEFIEGEAIDAQLFAVLRLQPAQIEAFFTAVETWDENTKTRVIIAVGEVGYPFNIDIDDPEGFDVDLYNLDTYADLAQHFLDEGLFGPIPENLQNYIDCEAIGRDLRVDYGSIEVAGTHYFYRCD